MEEANTTLLVNHQVPECKSGRRQFKTLDHLDPNSRDRPEKAGNKVVLRGLSNSLPLNSRTVFVDIFHWVTIRPGASPSHSPSRMAIRSRRDSGSRLVTRGGFSRSLSNSSAIGGFLIIGGIPLRGLFCVILCHSHVAQWSSIAYLQDTPH